jgi:hypothetical protein
MPYLKKDMRTKFDEHLDKISSIETKGELEYCIYKLLNIYMMDKARKYSTLHDTVYAAQHCADEFRRRNLDVREDEARKENGDI